MAEITESLPEIDDYADLDFNKIQNLKVPPHSIEAEQSVLGGLMLDNTAWERVGDVVLEEDFYRQDHQLIFKSIAALEAERSPFDVVTLSDWLKERNELEQAGGLTYLAQLANETPSAANTKAYAKIVRDRSILRQLIAAVGHIADMSHNPEGRKTEEIVDEAEREIFQIAERGARGKKGFESMQQLVVGAINYIETMFERGDGITGVPTGYDELDKMTSGFQPGDLVIVAGRPSMGKTSLAMNIAEYAAITQQVPVAIFSMEMPGDQLALRLISSHGRLNQKDLRTGKLRDEDWPRIASATNLLKDIPLHIDDTPSLTPTELRSRARRLARQLKVTQQEERKNMTEAQLAELKKKNVPDGLGLIVIDYLQLMQVAGKSENRATEISEISRSLKALAKELNVPVVALSQLNRSLEQRPNKRPIMSDLRESGAIEQDADLIVFIYRDEVYNPEDSEHKGIAEVIIGKQRNGPIGTIRLTFLGQYTRFENFVPDVYANQEF